MCCELAQILILKGEIKCNKLIVLFDCVNLIRVDHARFIPLSMPSAIHTLQEVPVTNGALTWGNLLLEEGNTIKKFSGSANIVSAVVSSNC